MRPSEVSEIYTETVSPPRSWQAVRRAEDVHAKLTSAEARVSELEHVNNAFRRGTERIAAAGNIDAILDSFLLETMHLSGAASGAIADRIAGTEFVLRSLAQDGVTAHPDTYSIESRFRQITAQDPAGVMARVVAGEVFSVSVDEIATWYPEAAAFYRAHGHETVWYFPFRSGGAVTGCLVLALADNRPLCDIKCGTVQALAQQASLALQVVRLAEEAKRGAIACEREKAAQSLAGELAGANRLMRATLDELANTQDPGGFVKATLREVCHQAQSCSAHLFTYDTHSNRLTQFGTMRGDVFYEGAHPDDPPSFREGFDADITPGFRRLLNREGIDWTTADTSNSDTWPGVMEWHRKMGHTAYASQVLMAGCKPIGLLGLTFQDRNPLPAGKIELIQILAQHMALALGLRQLTDHAREAAVSAERERAADHRACELAKINAALRNATDRLVTETELGSFYGHLVQEAAQLLGADSAHLTVVDEGLTSLRTLAYLKHGLLSVPDYPIQLSMSQISSATNRFCQSRDLQYLNLDQDHELFSRGAVEFHRNSGHRTLAAVPLVWSDRCMGYIGLAWVDELRLDSAQQELLQALAQHATLAVHLMRLADRVRRGAIFEERVAMAREMHDTLLQGFTGITLQLRALLKGTLRDPEQMHDLLEAIEAEATRSVREARRAVGDIRGNEPGAADLVTALQELVQSESTRTSAHLCWKLEGEPRELPGAVAESVFRIGREALSNAIRHSSADCIEVSLSLTPRSLRMSVVDNGRGFNRTSEMTGDQGHWGLVGMEERAAHLRGQCRIVSEFGGGTTVSIEIPV